MILDRHYRKQDQDNYGSIEALQLVPVEKLVHTPPPGVLSVATPIAQAKDIIHLYFSQESGSYRESYPPNVDDIQYGWTIACEMPGIVLQHLRHNYHYRYQRWIVIAKEIHGHARMFGTPDFPMQLVAGGDTGRTVATRKRTAMTFTGSGNAPAPIYTPYETIDLTYVKKFSQEFSDEFDKQEI